MPQQNKRPKAPWLRLLALVLCCAMLAAALPTLLLTGENTAAAPLPEPDALTALAVAPQLWVDESGLRRGTAWEVWLNGLFDAFFEVFQFLNYKFLPRELLVYNSKDAFQKLFGYNKLYDMFAFVANAYVDTLRCQFRYDGRDWLIQLWKGSYGIFLATGGEIGVYTKPTDRKAEHYDAAAESDWLGMEMTIFNRGQRLFTRPFGQYWWCTGYKVNYLNKFYQKPRVDCVMEARIVFPSEEMAELFAAALAEKGFAATEEGSIATPGTPEQFVLEGAAVHLVWQNVTESSY